MPTIQGRNLISEVTDKNVRRVIVLSDAVIFIKLYHVKLGSLSIFGVSLPPELFDVVFLTLILFSVYSLIINWLTDVGAFRLWYNESEIWSQFQTRMPINKTFYAGGKRLLASLFELEKKGQWPTDYNNLTQQQKDDYSEFKTNVELYITRLEYAGIKFRTITYFGHFYIWFQSFILPIGIAIFAVFLLFHDGNFLPPTVR
jgi:hypothetical protein